MSFKNFTDKTFKACLFWNNLFKKKTIKVVLAFCRSACLSRVWLIRLVLIMIAVEQDQKGTESNEASTSQQANEENSTLRTSLEESEKNLQESKVCCCSF